MIAYYKLLDLLNRKGITSEELRINGKEKKEWKKRAADISRLNSIK